MKELIDVMALLQREFGGTVSLIFDDQSRELMMVIGLAWADQSTRGTRAKMHLS